jgi:uncharacterized protein involved in exopolysaccharide biosynthesis
VAVQSSNPNQVHEFVDILRRRHWQVILPTAFVLALGVAIANFLPKRFDVTTRIELRESTLSGSGPGATVLQRDIGAVPMRLQNGNRIRDVLRKLAWQDYVGLTLPEQIEYEERVLSRLNVNVTPPGKQGGSSFIAIRYSDTDGQRAQKFLNTLRDDYIASEMKDTKDLAEKVLETLKELMLDRQAAYLEVTSQLTELKKSHMISATQDGRAGAQRNEDFVKIQLDTMRGELTELQSNLQAKRAEREVTHERYEIEPMSLEVVQTVAPVLKSSEIEAIESEIREKRDEQEGKTPINKTYRRLEQEIRDLEREKERLLAAVAPASKTEEWVPNEKRQGLYTRVQQLDIEIAGLQKREESLVANIKEAELRHTELQDVYANQAILQNELLIKESDYTLACENHARQKTYVERLDGPDANPFEVMEIAEASDVPDAPNVPVLILFAGIVGLGLGLGSAFASEYMRNGYRTVGELTRSLTVPVLGAVNSIVTRAESRRRMARRLAVGTSSMLMIGAILWVTWAYKNKPLMLGPQVTQLIEDLREQLR